MKKWLKVTLFSAIALFLVACGNGNSGEGAGGTDDVPQELNWTTSSELPTMDATQATDTVSFEVLSNTNEGLYRQGLEGGTELGVIAEDPEIAEDGVTYTYTI